MYFKDAIAPIWLEATINGYAEVRNSAIVTEEAAYRYSKAHNGDSGHIICSTMWKSGVRDCLRYLYNIAPEDINSDIDISPSYVLINKDYDKIILEGLVYNHRQGKNVVQSLNCGQTNTAFSISCGTNTYGILELSIRMEDKGVMVYKLDGQFYVKGTKYGVLLKMLANFVDVEPLRNNFPICTDSYYYAGIWDLAYVSVLATYDEFVLDKGAYGLSKTLIRVGDNGEQELIATVTFDNNTTIDLHIFRFTGNYLNCAITYAIALKRYESFGNDSKFAAELFPNLVNLWNTQTADLVDYKGLQAKRLLFSEGFINIIKIDSMKALLLLINAFGSKTWVLSSASQFECSCLDTDFARSHVNKTLNALFGVQTPSVSKYTIDEELNSALLTCLTKSGVQTSPEVSDAIRIVREALTYKASTEVKQVMVQTARAWLENKNGGANSEG